MAFLEILKDDILQLNFHTFNGSLTQFEELHGPFINLGAHLPPKHNSPKKKPLLQPQKRDSYWALKLPEPKINPFPKFWHPSPFPLWMESNRS